VADLDLGSLTHCPTFVLFATLLSRPRNCALLSGASLLFGWLLLCFCRPVTR